MLFKTFLLFCVFVNCYAADEGDPCTYNKQLGICVIINKCITALREIKLRKTPQICGYSNNTPVVCCLDELPTNSLAPLPPLPAIDSSSSNQPATPRPPSINVFTDTGQTPNGCAPVPAQLTAVKTGQKAFDKCIEYQEKYIYPCERGVTLTEDYYRGNYCHYDVDNLITSAWDTVKREFPHMAMLGAGSSLHNVNWFCSGTIVSERFILTAGQCQATAVEGPVKYAAVGLLSRQDLRDINNLYDVKRFIRHPNYSETLQPVAYMNDIALLEVETPIRLNQFVLPACLYSGDMDSSNVLATTWGHCGNEGQANDKIQKVNLQRIATDRCSRNYVFNTQKQECYASSQSGPNIGQADTGSSVIVKSRIHCMYLVIGVKSLKNSCDNTDPGVYTRVDTDLAWIESIVWP